MPNSTQMEVKNACLRPIESKIDSKVVAIY